MWYISAQFSTVQSCPVQSSTKSSTVRVISPDLTPHASPASSFEPNPHLPPHDPAAPNPPNVRPLTLPPLSPLASSTPSSPPNQDIIHRDMYYAPPTIPCVSPLSSISRPTDHPTHRIPRSRGEEKRGERDALSLTKYPIAPITTNPIPTACEIFRNSRLSAVCSTSRQQRSV